jgi:glutathione S-transferase
MLQVYLDPCTVNCRKVLAGLDLLGTKFNQNLVSYVAAEHKTADYKKINPCATLPTAVDGSLAITESNAILQYAADLEGNPAYPKDLKQRATVNRWLLWEASVWFPSCYIYLNENVVQPLFGAAPNQAALDANAPRWSELASILNDQLTKTKWIVGDDLTIADIAIAAPMHLHRIQKLPLDQYPHLQRWLTDGVEKLPCWQKTQGAVDKVFLPASGM